MGCTLPRDRSRVKVRGEATTKRKRIQITIQTDQILIARRRRGTRRWCPDCGCEVDMLSLGEVASITTRQPMLGHRARAQHWHYAEAEDGTTLVCLDSLLKSM
jgi:hypothetical protein